MSTPISTLEKIVDYASEGIFNRLNAMEEGLGDTPFMGERMTKRERLDEYKELRSKPYSLYYMMENVRTQVEEILIDVSPEEREAEGLSDEMVRKAAVSVVLKYVADMLKISEELNDPVVGSASMPPPPDPTLIGEETWASSKISSQPSPDMSLPISEPQNQMLPPLPPQPPLPPPAPEDGLFLP